jgi:hypothetical protein
VIPGLLQALQDPDESVRWSAAAALGNLGSAAVITDLWQLHLRQPAPYLKDAISAIQNRCQFYNYEIFQPHLAAQEADHSTSQNSDPNAITIQTLEKSTIMTDKSPIFNQQHATIGVNYAAEGSTIEFTQHTTSTPVLLNKPLRFCSPTTSNLFSNFSKNIPPWLTQPPCRKLLKPR